MRPAYDLDSVREKLKVRRPSQFPAAPVDSGADARNGADGVDGADGGLNGIVNAGLKSSSSVVRPRRAAVAAVLRPHGPETEVLLIRRAERPGDPWSGHMALPGGHHDPKDEDLRMTALRETLEEVGLDLRSHEYLGALDELPATIRGRRVGISIAPHVFALRGDASLRPNYEVAEIVWADLGPMARGETDHIKEWHYDGELRRVPAFNVQGHVVWGLTHHMLESLFEVLGWTRTHGAL